MMLYCEGAEACLLEMAMCTSCEGSTARYCAVSSGAEFARGKDAIIKAWRSLSWHVQGDKRQAVQHRPTVAKHPKQNTKS